MDILHENELRNLSDKNHCNNTEVQLLASKPLMDIIGRMRVSFEERKEAKDSFPPKSNTDKLNDEWLKLHNLMASRQPLGESPDLEYVFLVQFKICHNGITYLNYVPSPVTETVKTRNAEQIYLITRSLSGLRLIYCANGTSGSYYPDFSLHRMTMRLKIRPICPRFPTLLATIT